MRALVSFSLSLSLSLSLCGVFNKLFGHITIVSGCDKGSSKLTFKVLPRRALSQFKVFLNGTVSVLEHKFRGKLIFRMI